MHPLHWELKQCFVFFGIWNDILTYLLHIIKSHILFSFVANAIKLSTWFGGLPRGMKGKRKTIMTAQMKTRQKCSFQ